MSNWEPAVTKQITAFHFGFTLVIVAKGDKPTPCFEVEVVLSPLDIEPPQFVVQWRQKPGTRICPDVVTPYEVRGMFHMPFRHEVTVRDRNGAQSIPVKILKTALDEHLGRTEEAKAVSGSSAAKTASGGGGFPGPFGLAGTAGVRTAVGYSQKLSFDEAFANALHNLPPSKPSHPDEMEIVQVTDIGAEFGGIAGLQHLFVKITASSQ